MNEKRWIIFIITLVLLSLSGCCTRASVYGNGNGDAAVREHIGELEGKQTESAIAGERLNRTLESAREESEQLNREIAASREHSEQLKQSITDGETNLESLAAILQRIRARGCRNNSGKASPN
ncbi:hypothetical protein [Treponema sp.]|uniref:hypothetical protein n=1 Tax=Treponema sp. TaxID=166 RepID=UPI003FA33274